MEIAHEVVEKVSPSGRNYGRRMLMAHGSSALVSKCTTTLPRILFISRQFGLHKEQFLVRYPEQIKNIKQCNCCRIPGIRDKNGDYITKLPKQADQFAACSTFPEPGKALQFLSIKERMLADCKKSLSEYLINLLTFCRCFQ